jgi:hypothetical protein
MSRAIFDVTVEAEEAWNISPENLVASSPMVMMNTEEIPLTESNRSKSSMV